LRSAQANRNVSGTSRNGSFASLHAALEGTLPTADGAASEAIPENEEDHSHDTVSRRNSDERYSQSHDYAQPPPLSSFDRRVNSYFRRPGTGPSTPGSPVITPSPSRPSTPPPGPDGRPFDFHKSRSVLNLQTIVGEQTDFNLQKVDPFFTDPTGEYFNNFESSLDAVTAKNSEGKFCIEKYLEKSEKAWFAKRHDAKLGKSAPPSPAPSIFRVPRIGVRSVTDGSESGSEDRRRENDSEAGITQFALGQDFVPFKGLKRIMQLKIGDWQIYTILLAFVS
jgi:alpha-1,3-glucan synthase